MHYNVLRRSVKSGNKSVYRWYYSFIDPSRGIKKQRVIPDCHNRADAYLFSRGFNLPLKREYLESVFTRQLKIADIEKETRKHIPHSFRFTYVTRMRRGLSAETVQKLAGHSSVEMTEYYTRAAIPEMVEGLKEAVPAANMLFE